jgi:hypothetical protein
MISEPDQEWDPQMPPYKTILPGSNRLHESFKQIHSWLTECLENHKVCKAEFPKSMFTPTRLIEITKHRDDRLTIQLREGKSLKGRVKYATLSHAWGKSTPFKLTRQNLETCMQEIPMEKLSKVFKDAIHVASRCNIWYIWIDSICKYWIRSILQFR